MARYTLHGIWASGPTYKVGLFLTLAGLPFDYAHVDMMAGAHKREDYLAKNRYGVVPTLEDKEAGVTLCQSGSILEYLAETTGKFQPATPQARAQAREWVFWGWDRLARGVYRPRAFKFGFAKAVQDVVDHYVADGAAGLKDLNTQLTGKTWLVGEAASFADIDLYGVAAFAEQGGHDLSELANLKAWMARIEALPGFKGPNDLLPKEDRAA